MHQADSYFEKQDYPNAIFYYEIALHKLPKCEHALTRISACYSHYPDARAKTISYSHRAREINPKNFDARMLLAEAYYKQQRYDFAYGILDFVCKDYPHCTEAFDLRKKTRQAAKAAWEEANKDGPCYQNEYAAGLLDGRVHYKEDPTNPHLRSYWLFDSITNDPVIDPGPKDSLKLNEELKIADLYFEKHNYPYAAFHYQLALENHPKCKQALEGIAKAYYTNNDAKEITIDYLTRLRYASDFGTRKLENDLLETQCLIDLKRYDSAVSWVNWLTENHPESAKAWELYSKTYLGLNRPQPALRAAEEWARIEPDSISARNQRDEAIRALNECERLKKQGIHPS